MASHSTGRISRHGKACLNGLEGLCRLSMTSELSSDGCTAQLGRFRIWALNIGALQDAHLPTSLEYRLREAPKLVDRIVELLEDIEESIEDVSQIASGERPNRVGSDSEDDVHDTYNDPTEDDAQEVTELDEIFQSLADSISSLFKISLLIRSATPRDRYAKATTSVKQPFDDSFDISHVSHKHPKLEIKENQWLRNRLGQAITQRRQYLKYCREHHDKLGAEIVERSIPVKLEDNRAEQARTNDLSVEREERAPTLISKDRPASTLAFTTASTLLPSALESAEQGIDDSRSEFSEATSMADDSSGNQLHVMDVDKASKGMYPFECPYCFTLVRVRRQRPWKRHVFHDLKPYVCTFPNCDVKMFSDRHSWFTHELETHRKEYHCLFCPSLSFPSTSSFRTHLVRKHADKVTDTQIPAIVNVSQRPVTRISAKDCPFCDEWDQSLRAANPHVADEVLTVSNTQFRHHLASHLEQLALFSLPRNVDTEHDEEESRGTNAARAELVGSTGSKSSSIASTTPHGVLDPELHTAAYQGSYDEVVRLLGEGVDVNSLGPSWGTAIHAASVAGNASIVEFLIKNGADFHMCIKPLGTTLQAACRGGSGDVVTLLLAAGADPNMSSGKVTGNMFETSALHVASSLGNESIVQLLIEAGANVNAEASDFNSIRPLHLAASKGHSKVAKILLAHLADVDAPVGKESLETPLVYAAAGGWEEVVVVLINAGASFAHAGAGTKALHKAAYGDHEGVMRILLDSGADINLRTENKGLTPLHTATAAKKIGAVNFLLQSSADVEAQDNERNTALHVAAANGFLPITKILRAAKADIFFKNLEGETPLDVAVRCGHVNMVRYLLDESLASNFKPVFNPSLLETAIRSGQREIVRLVLESLPSSELGINGRRKAQAVFAAACTGKQDILDLLVSNGFDIDEKNELDETPLQTAASIGNIHALRLLLASGAGINLTTARGTALCYAASAGNAESVSYLLTKGAVVDLNAMRAAANKPSILSLLQWRDPARSDGATTDQPSPSTPFFSTDIDESSKDENTRFGSGPTVVLSPPDEQDRSSTLVSPAETAEWQTEAVENQLEMFINRATQNDLDLENMQEAFAVVDTITGNNEAVMAPLAIQIMCRRLKNSIPHVQLQTLSLASVLLKNCGIVLRQELVSERFCYALTRLTYGENSFEEARRAVVGMITDWLDRPELFFDHTGSVPIDVDLRHLQSALDIILSNDSKEFPGTQGSLETAQAANLFDLPAGTELFSIETDVEGQLVAVSRETGKRVALCPPPIEEDSVMRANYCEVCMRSYTAGEGVLEISSCGHLFHKNCVVQWLKGARASCPSCASLRGSTSEPAAVGKGLPQSTVKNDTESDPFSNWSGSGRHPVVFDQLANPEEWLPTRESTIYHGGRYRFHTVRWKNYVLTRKTVVLDDIWTRKDAFREVECLGLLMHSHIVQVVGSYSLGKRFSILLYPGTEWTLHQFLGQNAGQTEDVDARKRVVARFFACLISALGYIHDTRLRHGNIRPRSILVARSTSHQERYKVYLTGFDLAHRPRVPASVSSDTDEGEDETESSMGNARSSSAHGKHAAPEDFKGRSADIFSLGCVYLEMMALISTLPKARERLQAILNSQARELGKASLVYRQHIDEIRTWLAAFSTDSWIGNGDAAGVEANAQMETTLSELTSSMLDEDPSARPNASVILHGFSGEHDCCRRGRDEFEPDWFGANRALRDQVLQEVEGSVNKFKETM